jgi:hypothetical protein
MNSSLIEILKPRTSLFVSKGISSYEIKFGSINNYQYNKKLEEVFQEILVLILDKIQNDEPFSIESFKPNLLGSIIKIGVNVKYPIEILDYSVNELRTEVESLSFDYSQFLRILDRYVQLVKETLSDINLFSTSTSLSIIQSPPEYQYSDKKISVQEKDIDYEDGRVYPLFPKSRYWENYRNLTKSTSYTPLQYNRTANSLGKSELAIDISYRDGLIKDGEFYKLNAGIEEPSRNSFNNEEWTRKSSSRLSNEKKFVNLLDENIRKYYLSFLSFGFDINPVISDSKIEKYDNSDTEINKDDLVRTFGGEGKAVYESIQKLKESSEYLGGYEGSIMGTMDYISMFSDYLVASSYGRNENASFSIINGEESFGEFATLFFASSPPEKIPGLAFLDGFMGLKSFIQGQKINVDFTVNDKVVSYNPVAAMFSSGLKDRYRGTLGQNSYSNYKVSDLLLPALESAYKTCLYCGDLISSSLNSLDGSGRMPGFEGLGSVSVQLIELQKVFPPSALFIEDEGKTLLPGLTGAIRLFLNSYLKLQNSFISAELPSSSLEIILQGISVINEQVKEVVSSINKLGVDNFSYIPNISIKSFNTDNNSLIVFLRALGFRDSEVDRLNSVKNFPELIQFFAPLSDSSDLKSFFKGFELTQLIYELGGEEAIDSYLEFLYKKSDIDGLLNILSISQKKKSLTTTLLTNKYPTLIGLLIGLTYAIDPAQLVKFDRILGKNNLSLLESVSYLLQSGQSTIIKSKQDIELLQPVIDQAIQGNYPDPYLSPDLSYEQAKKVSPIGLKQWTNVINQSLGEVKSKKFVEYLYDRVVGLTAKELLVLLGGVSPNTLLGQILDGLEGGSFTRFLKYANITGLGIKLSSYKNSLQLNNFEVLPSSSPVGITAISDTLKNLSSILQITTSTFESSLNYDVGIKLDDYLEALIFTQNKDVETLNTTINSLLSTSDRDNVKDVKSLSGNGKIQESPGIGNSRLPNRIPLRNSITPEQFRVIFSPSSASSLPPSILRSLPSGLINNFFKFAENNKLINSVSTTDERSRVERAQASLPPEPGNILTSTLPTPGSINWNPATEFETTPQGIQKPKPLPYQVANVYKDLENIIGIREDALGASSLRVPQFGTLPSTKLSVSFNPVESCKRFGGENCEEIYQSVADRCVNNLNKSLYPEEYTSVPGSTPSSVAIDRPLGTFAEYKPSRQFIPTSSYSSPPIYVSLLEDKIYAFGPNGEPVLNEIQSIPLTFSSGGGEVSEYNNTEFGLVEGTKASLEKTTEFSCATLKSPFDYQLCMNIMKCKRFSTKFADRSYLPFCPRTMSGGMGK